ncbi:MAG TPA: AAA family ATPase [Phycisphaerales bacterium]|nr:AAA family ATPase [Phycisphaerales bacterium]
MPEATWARLAKADGDRWIIRERNAQGEVIGTAYRLADGEKDMEPGSKRGLIFEPPLPNYAGVAESDPIYVCEGASDTAAMLSMGLVAVGVAMAGHCGAMLADLLAGRHVVLVADADRAGRNGAMKLAREIAGRCASVRIIEPPDGAKDARDAVIAGAQRSAFESAAASASPWQPEPDSALAALPVGAPVVVELAQVKSERVRWLWPGRIGLGRLTLLAGRPGEGKSFVTMDLAARLSRGVAWPDGQPCECGGVVLVAGEDDPSDTIRPRLEAAGADLRQIVMLEGRKGTNREGVSVVQAFTLSDVETLRAVLAKRPNTKLVIIDPIGDFMGANVNSNQDTEVRAILGPLARLAREFDCAILLVAHTRKSEASHPDDTVLGSRAYTGIARCVLHVMADKDSPTRKLLLPGKSNNGKAAAGLAFTIDDDPARVVWEPEPVAITAMDAMAAAADAPAKRRRASEAIDFLQETLADGPMPAKQLFELARKARHSRRTLERVQVEAGVESYKDGMDGGWAWRLIEDRQTSEDGGLR